MLYNIDRISSSYVKYKLHCKKARDLIAINICSWKKNTIIQETIIIVTLLNRKTSLVARNRGNREIRDWRSLDHVVARGRSTNIRVIRMKIFSSCFIRRTDGRSALKSIARDA